MGNAIDPRKSKEVATTTSLIFDVLFAAIIPYSSTRTREEIRLRGLPVSGVRGYDDRFHNSRTRVMLSIADMVVKYREGHALAICNEADLTTIYDYVQRHLFAWTDAMEGASVNLIPPLEDLIALDQFADSLFNYVKYEPKKTAAQDFFDKYRGKRASFSKDKLFDPEKLRSFLENDPVKVEQRRQEAIYGSASVVDNGDSVSVKGRAAIDSDIYRPQAQQFEVRERESLTDFFRDRRAQYGNKS